MNKRYSLVIFCLVVLTLSSGCGLFGPGADDPRLVSEHDGAREALKEAEFERADQFATEKYNDAVNVFESVREEHQQSPSEEIIAKYRRAQIMANRATIDSLKNRMDREQERLETKDEEIDKLQSSRQELQQQTASLEESLTEHQEIAKEYRQAKKELEQLREQYEKQSQKLSSLRAERRQLREEIEQYQQVVDNMEENIDRVRRQARDLQAQLDEKTAELEDLQRENIAVAEELQEKVREAEVRHDKRGVVINLESQILFDVGDDLLKDEAKNTLKKVAAVLNEYPDRKIHVEGHTCDMPIKERHPSNWELSAHRAIAVLKYLVYAQDVERERIAAVAHGEFKPLVPNDSDQNRQLNRRVEITLLPPEIEQETKELVPES